MKPHLFQLKRSAEIGMLKVLLIHLNFPVTFITWASGIQIPQCFFFFYKTKILK